MNLLDIFFPKRCVSCGKIGRYFCTNCKVKIKFTQYQICPVCEGKAIDGVTHPGCKTRYTLDGLRSFLLYEGIIRKAVKLLKYRFVSDLAKEFIDLIPSLSLQPITHNLKPITLIPIPLHPTRLKFRGFNQTEVLGKYLAKRLSISMKTDILIRMRKTIPQVDMKDRTERLKNMEDVFSVNSRLSGIHDAVFTHSSQTASGQSTVILFDDVFTTGATLRTAANILKRSGIPKVWGVVLAHG